MTEPFATVDKHCNIVTHDGVHLGPHYQNCPFFNQVNASARKYAADKIREAADDAELEAVTDGGPIDRFQAWLRSRADAVERGEA